MMRRAIVALLASLALGSAHAADDPADAPDASQAEQQALYQQALQALSEGRRTDASQLLRRLIAECEARGHRQMIAVIGDSANAGSVGVHTRAGFTMIGTHPSVGLKFGRWLDTVMMQLALGEGDTTIPAGDA